MKKWLVLICCMALCLCVILPANAAGQASLSLSTSTASAYGGDVITLSMRMTADAMGGLQTSLIWNAGYLTYVDGSAAFADAFKDNAMVAQVNAQEGCIRLLYASPAGYTAKNEVIFTARFRLNEGVYGTTTFELMDTKMSDATANLNAMSVAVQSASVYTQVFDPGVAYFGFAMQDYAQQWPGVGDTVTVQLVLSGDKIGSAQGTILYDPDVLMLENGGAVFTADAEQAAFTKNLNTATKGAIQFVYAAMDGCPATPLIELRFKVVAQADYTTIGVVDAKATNADAAHLMQMTCWPSELWLYPQGASGGVAYTLSVAPGVSCTDDVIALNLSADGPAFGGMQGTLNYDASQLEYVSDSAAFTNEFAAGADIKLINDAKAGHIQLVYASSEGYTPNGGNIFTVKFRRKAETDLAPVTMTDLKTTNAGGAEVQEIVSTFVQGVDWEKILHTIVIDSAIEATCTAEGKTQGKHCSVCNTVLTAQTTIPAKGHSWDAGVVTRKPTTTAEGVLTYTCAACKTTKTERIPIRVPGDANSDGKVDLNDALLVFEYGSGKNVSINLYNADVNQDGRVDAQDALLIMQYVSGWDVKLK